MLVKLLNASAEINKQEKKTSYTRRKKLWWEKMTSASCLSCRATRGEECCHKATLYSLQGLTTSRGLRGSWLVHYNNSCSVKIMPHASIQLSYVHSSYYIMLIVIATGILSQLLMCSYFIMYAPFYFQRWTVGVFCDLDNYNVLFAFPKKYHGSHSMIHQLWRGFTFLLIRSTHREAQHKLNFTH